MADSSSSGLASTQAALLLEKPRLTVQAVWTISDLPSGYGQVSFADSIFGWAGRFSAEVPSSLEAQGTTGAKTEPGSPVSGGILAKVKANRVSIAHAI